MKYFTIDRFENLYAICEDEDKNMFQILISKLPDNTKPGDIISVSDTGDFKYEHELSLKRKSYIKKLQDDLWR